MTTKHKYDDPILVTGAAGAVGGIGRNLTEFLLAWGHKVRALVRREDKRAEALRRLGAEVVEGDLTDLASMHRAIEGCGRIYFGMSVSPAYLEAAINTAAVARYHGVAAFVNMSQMTVTQMSINETTDSPQHKLHWLAEQALSWSGLPVVTVRPTVFLEGFFLQLAAADVRASDELALPMGGGKTSPISAVDVARAVARLRLRLLHREQVDHLAPAPHRLVPRQHAGLGALLGIDPAFQAARHGRYAGCPHAVLLFGRNPLNDHCPVS